MSDLIDRKKLYNYLNDWSFSIAPDERHVGTERLIRQVRYETIQECMSVVEDLQSAEQSMTATSNTVICDEIVTDLESIWDKLWEIDIPSPTVPEYIEHHEQVQHVMKYVTKLSCKYANKYKQADKRRTEDERQ